MLPLAFIALLAIGVIIVGTLIGAMVVAFSGPVTRLMQSGVVRCVATMMAAGLMICLGAAFWLMMGTGVLPDARKDAAIVIAARNEHRNIEISF